MLSHVLFPILYHQSWHVKFSTKLSNEKGQNRAEGCTAKELELWSESGLIYKIKQTQLCN